MEVDYSSSIIISWQAVIDDTIKCPFWLNFEFFSRYFVALVHISLRRILLAIFFSYVKIKKQAYDISVGTLFLLNPSERHERFTKKIASKFHFMEEISFDISNCRRSFVYLILRPFRFHRRNFAIFSFWGCLSHPKIGQHFVFFVYILVR